MEKIKQILKPGGNKDDETMYGDKETRLQESRENTTQGSASTAVPATGGIIQPGEKLETKPEAEKEHGVLRQIVNPGGAKRDDIAYGSTAETTTGEPRQMTGKDTGGVMSQITNPGGNKYDEQRFDTTRTAGAGTTAGGLGTSAAGTTVSRVVQDDDAKSTLSIKSGVEGPYAGETDGEVTGNATGSTAPLGSTGTAQTLPDRTAPATTSHLGRDTAILGTGAVAGTGAGMAAARHNESQGGILDRSHPLRDGTDSTADHINPVGAPGLSQGTGVSSASAPPPTGLNSYNDNSNFGRDTGLLGAAGLAGAGAAATGTHSSNQSGTGNSSSAIHPGGQHLDCDGNPVAGYVHHTSGPHSTDIANQLDPNIGGGPGLAAYSGSAQHASGAQTGTESHLGRDAALVGGAGAVGAGAYAATRDHNPATATHGSAEGQTPASYGGANPALDPQHGAGLSQTRTTYGGTQPEIDRKHEGVAGGRATYGGTHPEIDRKHEGLAGGHTTYGGTHPEIDRRHEGAAGGHTTYGGTHPEIGRKHEGADAGAAGVGAAGVYGGSSSHMDEKHERKLQQAREEEAEKGGDHGEKKPSLIQRILHPGSHEKDHTDRKHDSELGDRHHEQIRADRDINDNSQLSSEGHEHSHVQTAVDEKGHTKLHKDPPASHPAAQSSSAGIAGPDWDAVNQANRTT